MSAWSSCVWGAHFCGFRKPNRWWWHQASSKSADPEFFGGTLHECWYTNDLWHHLGVFSMAFKRHKKHMLTWLGACNCFSLYPTLRGHLWVFKFEIIFLRWKQWVLFATQDFWLLSEPTGRNLVAEDPLWWRVWSIPERLQQRLVSRCSLLVLMECLCQERDSNAKAPLELHAPGSLISFWGDCEKENGKLLRFTRLLIALRTGRAAFFQICR